MKRRAVLSTMMVSIIAVACAQISLSESVRADEPQPPIAAPPSIAPVPVEGPPVPTDVEVSPLQLPPAVLDGHGLSTPMTKAVAAMNAAAKEAGFEIKITDGYVTPAEQGRRYAKAQKARGADTRDSKPAWESAHVRGDAIDVGPAWVVPWVVAHQEEFGLCQTSTTFEDHFELKDPAKPCPAPTPGGEDG